MKTRSMRSRHLYHPSLQAQRAICCGIAREGHEKNVMYYDSESDNETTPTPSIINISMLNSPLLSLPFELRAHIIRYVLQEQPAIEQHYPITRPSYLYGRTSLSFSPHCINQEQRLQVVEIRNQADMTVDLEKKLLLLQVLPLPYGLQEAEHSLFFTCKSLRRDYIDELSNPVIDYRLHVFNVDDAWSFPATISGIAALEPFPTQARRIKVRLTLFIPYPPARVGSDRLPESFSSFEFLRAFLEPFKAVKHVTITAWKESFADKLTRDGLTNILENLQSLQEYKLERGGSMGSKICAIKQVKRWTGQWTSPQQARRLDLEEAARLEVERGKEDARMCDREVQNFDRVTKKKLRKLRRVLASKSVKERTQGLTEILGELFFL